MGGSHVRVGRSRVGGQWENRVEYGREVAPFTKAPAASPDSGAERPSLNATPVPPPHQVPPAIPSPPACWVPSAAPSQSTPGTLARTSPAPSPSCPRLSTPPTSTPTLWPVPWATCPQQGQGEAPALRPCWLPPRRAWAPSAPRAWQQPLAWHCRGLGAQRPRWGARTATQSWRLPTSAAAALTARERRASPCPPRPKRAKGVSAAESG